MNNSIGSIKKLGGEDPQDDNEPSEVAPKKEEQAPQKLRLRGAVEEPDQREGGCPNCHAPLNVEEMLCVQCGFMDKKMHKQKQKDDKKRDKEIQARYSSSKSSARSNEPNYGGVGRLAYFFLSVGSQIGINVMAFSLGGSPEDAGAKIVPFVIGWIIFSFWLVLARIKNMGGQWTMIFRFFIPIYNIWLGLKLMSDPPGYQIHGILDTPAIILRLLFLAYIGAIIWFFVSFSAQVSAGVAG